MTALEFSPDGTLLGATTDGEVLSINPDSGTASVIGTYGHGLGSSGDLVTAPDGSLLGTATRGSGDDVLVRIDPTPERLPSSATRTSASGTSTGCSSTRATG